MDHEQALTEVEALFTGVQDVVGGEWESLDRGARACQLPSGGNGAQFPLARLGPGVPVAEQKAIIAAIVEDWTAAGFAPSIAEQAPVNGVPNVEVRYPSEAYGEDGLTLRFGIAETGSFLDGQTRCVPGDSREINRL